MFDLDKSEIIELVSDSNGVKSDLGFLRKIQNQSKKSLEDEENGDILKMRKMWSEWILFFIGLIVVFDIILVILYGSGMLNFEDSNVVIVVITESFLKIIGLGVLITNSIFKKIYR